MEVGQGDRAYRILKAHIRSQKNIALNACRVGLATRTDIDSPATLIPQSALRDRLMTQPSDKAVGVGLADLLCPVRAQALACLAMRCVYSVWGIGSPDRPVRRFHQTAERLPMTCLAPNRLANLDAHTDAW